MCISFQTETFKTFAAHIVSVVMRAYAVDSHFWFFLLYGHLQELVYGDAMTTQAVFATRLHGACISMGTALLPHVHSSISRHAKAYLDMQGRHFNHLR